MALFKRFNVLLFSFLIFTSTSVFALDLQSAKQQKLVGETVRGYVAIVKSSTPELQGLVDDTNEARAKHYAEIAKRNGIERSAVEIQAGKRLTERAPSGEYVKNSSGQWILK